MWQRQSVESPVVSVEWLETDVACACYVRITPLFERIKIIIIFFFLHKNSFEARTPTICDWKAIRTSQHIFLSFSASLCEFVQFRAVGTRCMRRVHNCGVFGRCAKNIRSLCSKARIIRNCGTVWHLMRKREREREQIVSVCCNCVKSWEVSMPNHS